MENRAHLNKDFHKQQRKGTLDSRDPVEIAGSDARYAELEYANVAKDAEYDQKSGGLSGLKKRIGSLRHRNRDE